MSWMHALARKGFLLLAVLAALCLVGWATWLDPLPPADFTFVNGTEIKSVDPAIVTGQPEGRVIRALFEGLVNWDPQYLQPIPGVAQSWELSDDGQVYTFHLREDAVWTNLRNKKRPVIAEDFVWSIRRFLDPMTGAEYAPLLAEVKNAEKYNQGNIQEGDAVEVELSVQRPGSLPHARNEVLKGTLTTLVEEQIGDGSAQPVLIYHINIDGTPRLFSPQAEQLDDPAVEVCRQVLLDFDTVGIRAKDARTLEIELIVPVPYFLNLMGFYPLFPTSRECVETFGYPEWTRPENMMVNGPFLMRRRRVRDRIRFVKNPHYWDQENVHFQTMDALAIQSSTTSLNMYLTGKVDWINDVPATIIPELLEQNRDDFQPEAFLGIYYYRLNTTEPPLDDLRVRRALALAIDRTNIVENVTRAGEIPAYTFVPPGIADYETVKGSQADEGRTLGFDGTNVAAARSLLEDAGYGADGADFPTIELLYNTHQTHSQIAELVQSQWKENLGIDVSLVNKEWGSYLADQRNLEYNVARAGWIGDYVDPHTFLYLFQSDNPQNQTGWANSEYDQLVSDSRFVRLTAEERQAIETQVRGEEGWSPPAHDDLFAAAVDEATRLKRMAMFFEAERLLLDDQVVIPIYYYVSKNMVQPYVKGFYRNIQDTHPFQGMRIERE